ncbi:MAG: DUF1329 domain-containing protein [Betaproteobacteria bacterium HGW-Betaproteobacteria-7]|jgi:hypothetical protein|nr:MAG: DUF1329 domain-containing protein [Betaproteobacteria bacterium HGW-Betaproteobacteria-7]
MKYQQTFLAVVAALATGAASAAVSPEEAKALGTTLTQVGAQMAANKDGSIPAYTGGLTKAPAGFKAGDATRPDPFASEKPKFSITAANMGQYEDKLTAGTKELLKRNASYRIDVYPTHRTVALPKAVIENTLKNATRAKTTNEGRVVEGAVGGYPFPIPKNGYEVMWNHLLRYVGVAYRLSYKSWNVDSSGSSTLATAGVLTEDYPYYGQSANDSGIFWRLRSDYTGPARRVGETLMVHDNINPMEKSRRAWQYLPGQRRVKLAPDISYDAPNPGTSGATTYDDTFIFNGAMDRYDFKLVGQKEMIVPYNNYRLVYQSKAEQLLKAKHINPDAERWELHRVWVVEATLKPGSRHVYAKRVFYIDEDSWIGLASDGYDARGQLYRSLFAYMTPSYDVAAQFSANFVSYDFIAGMYSLSVHPGESGGVKYSSTLFPDKEWTPDSMAGSGIR